MKGITLLQKGMVLTTFVFAVILCRFWGYHHGLGLAVPLFTHKTKLWLHPGLVWRSLLGASTTSQTLRVWESLFKSPLLVQIKTQNWLEMTQPLGVPPKYLLHGAVASWLYYLCSPSIYQIGSDCDYHEYKEECSVLINYCRRAVDCREPLWDSLSMV